MLIFEFLHFSKEVNFIFRLIYSLPPYLYFGFDLSTCNYKQIDIFIWRHDGNRGIWPAIWKLESLFWLSHKAEHQRPLLFHLRSWPISLTQPHHHPRYYQISNQILSTDPKPSLKKYSWIREKIVSCKDRAFLNKFLRKLRFKFYNSPRAVKSDGQSASGNSGDCN